MGSEKLFCYADESSTPYEENEHDWSEQDDIILEKVTKRDLYLMDETDAPYKEREYERTVADDIVLLNIVKEHNLELREGSRLYQVNQQLHIV